MRDVQRNRRWPRDQGGLLSSQVSIRCRARRTAEPGRSPLPVSARRIVSIRCRARRTAEHTRHLETAIRPRGVSIRCRARRTAERSTRLRSRRSSSGFYSLSCETYSGTTSTTTTTSPTTCFLFAVVRDVQRNGVVSTPVTRLADVSIRCRARRTAERAGDPAHLESGPTPNPFLFAVVRDVQRNPESTSPAASTTVSIRCRARRTAELGAIVRSSTKASGFYSLSCETYSGTSATESGRSPRHVSIRCRARRTAEPGGTQAVSQYPSFSSVSIRCRARRTAEHGDPARASPPRSFYSLSCETYSGTLPPPGPPLTCGNDVRLHTRPPEPSVALSSTHQ